ncbi:MAG: phosphate butyryltransferase [Firmicutes bacterium]|nr:phosphate butyryltransferase [Bacillota bacterium]
MIRNFEELRELALGGAKANGGYVVSVANAADREVIETVKELRRLGIAEAILTGERAVIEDMCKEMGLDPIPEIVEAEGEVDSAEKAVRLVRDGRAHVLMKGLVNTSTFLRAVLNPEWGVRGEGLLCHLGAFDIPSWPKIQFHTDAGMIPAPTLEQKKQMIKQAVEILQRLGVEEPKVAALAANEVVNPKMPVTIEAAQLQKWNEEGEITGCIVEGPIALDVALSKQAAEHKKLSSKIAGETDLFLMPDIEAGNLVGKTLMFLAGAKMAGIILGAKCPIVLVSRSDNAEAKVNSLAFALASLKGE